MKRIFQMLAGVAFAAALLCSTACSSSDDETKVPEPTPTPTPTPTPDPMEQRIKEVTTPGNDAQPSWTMDNTLYDQYEQTMAVQVVPQKFLTEYVSDADMMCATIGGQVRAVASAEQTSGAYYFPLVVAGNGNEGYVSVNYYCAKLKRTYTIANWVQFNTDLTPSVMGEPLELVFYQDIFDWWIQQKM